jgi:DNA-binding SARP family transcriptional activator
VVVSPPEARVEFRILGPLEAVAEGRVVTLGGSRQRTLLALLLVRANQVVSTDRLIDALWGAQPPRTAANSLQYHISQLRRTLAPAGAIVTKDPGYVIRLEQGELDLFQFERLVSDAQRSSPELAARLLRDALGLWRGPALADLARESFARPEILRLEELRLGALDARCEADLALGRHAEVVGELELLVREHPLRERLRAQLMRALYGSGRQAEALDVYRETRRLLVEELGIEPSPALRELEAAILRQDASLTPSAGAGVPRERTILVVADTAKHLDELLAIAEPLARKPARTLILARLLRHAADLPATNAELAERRDALAQRGVSSRVAAYTTAEPGMEAARFATERDVDLVLVGAHLPLLKSGRPDRDLGAILEAAPCDVAVLIGRGHISAGPIVVPFGGVAHDWSAIELAAWLAGSLGTTLRLLGTEADSVNGRRDASRLLARASLLVQQVVGIVTEPVLVPAGEGGILEASRDCGLLVVGLSDRWRAEGLGATRLAVASDSTVPTLFVRRGLRPSAVAPNETLTRFSWTVVSQRDGPAS